MNHKNHRGDGKVSSTISNYLSKLEFGKPLKYKNMGVIPLFTSIDSIEYLTLKEALNKKLLIITEVSKGGAVPELKVTNKAEMPVLLLDGEELVGAKQNRILNTTILLKEKSETIIPVSCTEQGRWSYKSDKFNVSDVIAAHNIRAKKASSVSANLSNSNEFASDQFEVWNEIDRIARNTNIHSETGAMKDIFYAKMEDLDKFLEAFKCEPHQKGLLITINGEVVGFDAISLESAYKKLHPKLVKSYAMDALLQKKKKSVLPSIEKAKTFIKEAISAHGKKYKSIGYGWDYRFESENIVGSALIYNRNVIHTAFFRIEKSDEVGTIAGYDRRKHYRIYM